jgi:DsbC/DsbD-like thiol-disulfide interchange protein
MKRVSAWLVVGWAIALASATADAQLKRAAELVKVELLADVETVQPARPFKVGVLLKVAPEWHVYWENPGDAGQAVTATFEVPAGFAVSELAYPVPKKFVQPGDLVAYGYGGEVMLIATVTPPKELASAGKVEINARVKYLVCDEKACLPGKGEGTVSLAVSGEARPANAELFDEWAKRVPVAAKDVADVNVTGAGGDGPYAIDIAWKDEATDVQFFPGKSGTVTVGDIEVTGGGKRSRVTFDASLLAGQKPDVAALESVVAYTDVRGARRGIEVAVPTGSEKK